MSNLSNSANDEINLGEVFAALWAHKILIVFLTFLSTFIAGYHALTADKQFTARSIFQIEESSNSGFNINAELGALASLAGFGNQSSTDTDSLLERLAGREFILSLNKNSDLSNDPFFNTYDPNYQDPLWKSIIKKLVNWQKTTRDPTAIIEKNILKNFLENVIIEETDTSAISISVTHSDPEKASYYANKFMDEIRKLVQKENTASQELRLSYLSETLADALQDMENAQQNLKDYALKNSALAQENFISDSLKLDNIRMERRKVGEIASVLSILDELTKSGNLNLESYQELRSDHPLVDDLEFRRILGMSETISAWTWPKNETIEAVSATLRDRIKRLDIDIQIIEENAKIYATSAEDLAKFTRDAKIAEATYTSY